jgi:hypothetical protein
MRAVDGPRYTTQTTTRLVPRVVYDAVSETTDVERVPSFMAPTSFWNARKPAGRLIDTANTPKAVAELKAAAAKTAPTINIERYSTAAPGVIVISKNDPDLVWEKLWLHRGGVQQSWQKPVQEIFDAEGFPLPRWFTEQADSDGACCVYVPDYEVEGPDGIYRGWYGEAWTITNTPSFALPAGYSYASGNANRIVGVDRCPGYVVDRPQYPKARSAYTNPKVQAVYQNRMGGWVCATATSLGAGLLTEEDCRRGVVNHALGLAVPDARRFDWTNRATFPWPAQASDGGNAALFLAEGMAITLPDDLELDPTWHPLLKLIVQGTRDFGSYIIDRTHSCLAWRGEPRIAPYRNGTPAWAILQRFPWERVQLMTPGRDAAPHPVALAT